MVVNVLNKESVELTSVYLVRGSDKTLKRINDTRPHTWIVWDICTKSVHSHITIQEMSAVVILVSLKLSDFLPRIKAKTLSSICNAEEITPTTPQN